MRQGWQLFSANSVKTYLVSKLLHNGEEDYFPHGNVLVALTLKCFCSFMYILR